MKKKAMKMLWADLETGGLSPKDADILQIAGIVEIDGKPVEEFNFLMRPDSPERAQPGALAVQKRTLEQVMAHPLSQREGYQALSLVLEKYCDKFDKEDKFYLCGQNPVFDDGFLRDLWAKQGDKYYGSFVWPYKIDLLTAMAIVRMRGHFTAMPNLKLASVCDAFGIKLGKRAHDALADIKATRECFGRVLELVPAAGQPADRDAQLELGV